MRLSVLLFVVFSFAGLHVHAEKSEIKVVKRGIVSWGQSGYNDGYIVTYQRLEDSATECVPSSKPLKELMIEDGSETTLDLKEHSGFRAGRKYLITVKAYFDIEKMHAPCKGHLFRKSRYAPIKCTSVPAGPFCIHYSPAFFEPQQ